MQQSAVTCHIFLSSGKSNILPGGYKSFVGDFSEFQSFQALSMHRGRGGGLRHLPTSSYNVKRESAAAGWRLSVARAEHSNTRTGRFKQTKMFFVRRNDPEVKSRHVCADRDTTSVSLPTGLLFNGTCWSKTRQHAVRGAI